MVSISLISKTVALVPGRTLKRKAMGSNVQAPPGYPWPDPPCVHPAALTEGTTVAVTSWLQPNHTRFCSNTTPFLTYKSATRGFYLYHILHADAFHIMPYGNSVCSVEVASGFCNKITHWHS